MLASMAQPRAAAGRQLQDMLSSAAGGVFCLPPQAQSVDAPCRSRGS